MDHELIINQVENITQYWLTNLTDYSDKDKSILELLSLNFIDWNTLEVSTEETLGKVVMSGLKKTLEFYGKPKNLNG